MVATDVTQMHTEIIKLPTVYSVTKRYKIRHKTTGTIITLRDNTFRIDYSPALMAQVVKGSSVDAQVDKKNTR
jgi:hypothetical protein